MGAPEKASTGASRPATAPLADSEDGGARGDSARGALTTEGPGRSLPARRFVGRDARLPWAVLADVQGSGVSSAAAVCRDPPDSSREAEDAGPRDVADDAALFRAAGFALGVSVGLREVPAAFFTTARADGS